jgi:hypothetical protein
MDTLPIITKTAEQLGVTCKIGDEHIDLDGDNLAGTYRNTPAGRTAALEDLTRLKCNRHIPATGGKLRIELNAILSIDPDTAMYQCQPGDKETLANISIADLKEVLLAINVCSRRIHYLLEDLKNAENRIEKVEQRPIFE